MVTTEPIMKDTVDDNDDMAVTLRRYSTFKPMDGNYVKMAIGYKHTFLDGRYLLADDRHNKLLLKADHQAQWGFRTLEWSAASLDYSHLFSSTNAELYAKLSGASLFFTRYGRYYLDASDSYSVAERNSALGESDRQDMWRATATVGIRSAQGSQLQYQLEAVGQYYTFRQIMSEYQANLRFNISYLLTDNNKIGTRIYNENQFVRLSESTQVYYDQNNLVVTPNHCVRIEPFYEYRSDRLSLHMGVNLDFNIGKGNQFSHTTDATPFARQIAFAPSPSVKLDVTIVPHKLALYAGVLGSFGTSSMTGYVRLNPYIGVKGAPSSHHVSSYIPVAAKLGFLVTPLDDLQIKLEAGYRYALNQAECGVSQSTDGITSWGMMTILYNDFQRWRSGVDLTYHYKTYFSMHLKGDYYFYRHVKNNTSGRSIGSLGANCYTEGRAYDRPAWELTARFEGHIRNRLTLYSDNTFRAHRWAITSMGDRRLPAFIDMNIGAAYQFAGSGNPALERLSLFAELQNILNRRNMVWYGYDSEQIHGRIGVTYYF